MNKLRILFKPIGKPPKEMYIDKTLESEQKLVGGYIECVDYGDDKVLICNEEGKINGLYPNVIFPEDVIAGNFFVAGDDYENADFKNLTTKQIEDLKKDLINKSVHYTPTQMKAILQQEQELNREFEEQNNNKLEEFYTDMEKDLMKDPNGEDLNCLEKDFNSMLKSQKFNNITNENRGDGNEHTR